MDLGQAAANLSILPVRLRIVPKDVLQLPALNKGNTLRGAFGTAFRRLVCIPQCLEARRCPLNGTCPYRVVFEPSPPPGAGRLTKNQDIPRPFIFRPPLDTEPDVEPGLSPAPAAGGGIVRAVSDGSAAVGTPPPQKASRPKTRYAPGEPFDFTLTLVGKAVDYLPYFILAFRDVAREGIGLNRARCELAEVAFTNPTSRQSTPPSPSEGSAGKTKPTLPSPPWGRGWLATGALTSRGETGEGVSTATAKAEGEETLVYSARDELFRAPQPITLADYIQSRLAQLSGCSSGLSTGHNSLSTLHGSLSTVFLSPTYLKSDGQAVRQPEFHHLFKRVRDRLNALCTFYGPGPIDADFKGLGEAAERVRTVSRHVQWEERSRRSSKTGQRHELSGFTGSCTYEFPDLQSGILNFELLQWLICGELLHAGRHTAWGNGWYRLNTLSG